MKSARPTTTTTTGETMSIAHTISIPTPANSGVLVLLWDGPKSVWEDDQSPKTGCVAAVGGGVPWLRPGEGVTFDVTGAVFYEGNFAIVNQRSIIAHQRDVVRADICRNGCHGKSACSECPPREARWDASIMDHALPAA